MSPHGKETAGPRASARPDAAAGASATPRFARLTVPWLVVLLLAVHAAMVIPGIFRNSVTFDENFHLPAGALYLERGYTHVSVGQPPLARALYALPVMPLRPKLPPDSILVINAERAAGHSFLSLNADRFETLYITARFVALLMSLGVGLLIFAFARSLYGPAAGLLGLAAWVAMPEAVAQAGLIGMDLPTALVFLLVVMALRGLVMHGRLRDVALMTLACGAALLTRYSVLQLVPVLIALAVWAVVARRAARPAWLFGGLIVAFLGAVVLLDLGYLGQVSMLPMGQRGISSQTLKNVAQQLPWLRLPLPDAFIAGFDYLSFITESVKPIFVLGSPRTESVWWYFPLAAAVKWPLGLLGLLAARIVHAARRPGRPSWDEGSVLLPGLMVIAVAMTSDLAYGLRYLLPAMPFLCVWIGGLMAAPGSAEARAGEAVALQPRAVGGGEARAGGRVNARNVRDARNASNAGNEGDARNARKAGNAGARVRRPARAWAITAAALVAAQTVECALATPWQLAHFNAFAGGRGDRIVNDSSVDWGQGLIALRDEMKRRGIPRVSLTYHGTTDPALYVIDYIPYKGGLPDTSVAWLAVSSYYLVGLSQRMVTPEGDTPFMSIDFKPFWDIPPAATPANCMYLFRLPGR